MPYVKPEPLSSPPPPPLPPRSTASVGDSSSPPLSPVSSIPPSTDDEFDMSDSWLDVAEQSSAGRSSVGPSVLGDVAFSDTSSDSHDNENGHDHEVESHWSNSSDGGDYPDGEELGDTPIAPDPSSIGSPSLAGGEYTDAEASVSRLDSSVGTIHSEQEAVSPSSSQIRLIFPDPGSSFSSSSGTLSAGFTPSASISGFTPMPQPDQSRHPRAGILEAAENLKAPPKHSGRGIDDSWLRSTKLWTPPNEVMQSVTSDKYDYQLLSSTDDVDRIEDDLSENREGNLLQMPKVNVAPEQADVDRVTSFPEPSKIVTDKSFPVTPETKAEASDVLEVFTLEQVFKTDNLAQLKAAAKKWSTRMSLLALASVISLALFQSFGPSAALSSFSHQSQAKATAPTSMTTPVPSSKPPSIWDSLPSFLPIPHSSTSTPAASSFTTSQPDIQVIRQALSTLSTLQDKLSAAANRASTTEPSKMKPEPPVTPQGQNLRSSTSCCSVSIRDDRVALTVPVPAAEKQMSIAQKLTHKLLGVNKTSETVENATVAQATAAPDCTCSLSTYVQSEVLARIAATFASTRYYTVSTSQYFGHLFGPLLASLEHKLSLLANVTRHYASSAAATSQAALSQAARGANICHKRMNAVIHRATDGMSSLINSPKDNDIRHERSTGNAHDVLDSLTEYVESHLDGLSDLIAEEAEAIQEKGWDCIYQARSGLDKLISDVKKLHPKSKGSEKVVESSFNVEVETDGPLPFAHMEVHPPVTRLARLGRRERNQLPREGRARGSARRERRAERRYVERNLRGKRVNVIVPPIPAPEKPSKAKRVMDLVHHGAMAFVI